MEKKVVERLAVEETVTENLKIDSHIVTRPEAEEQRGKVYVRTERIWYQCTEHNILSCAKGYPNKKQK